MFHWNPADYAAHSAAQAGWAEEVIQRLNLRGDERILDIGSGDGKMTAALARRVPRGRVTGLDSSPEMIRHARAAHAGALAPNLEFVLGDAQRLDLAGSYDIVFSNATLHWVRDHAAFLQGAARVLRAGGRLALSFGGRGNAQAVVDVCEKLIREPPWQELFAGFESPYFFPGPDEYQELLAAAGFEPIRVALVDKETFHAGLEGLAAWIRTTWLPYTCCVPESRRSLFIETIARRYLYQHPPDADGRIRIHMVRLEVEAMKA